MKTAQPTQVLSIATLFSTFQMVCHNFCGALYVRKCRNQIFYNAISKVDILGDRAQ